MKQLLGLKIFLGGWGLSPSSELQDESQATWHDWVSDVRLTGTHSNRGSVCFVYARLDSLFSFCVPTPPVDFIHLPVHCDCAPLQCVPCEGGVELKTSSSIIVWREAISLRANIVALNEYVFCHLCGN